MVRAISILAAMLMIAVVSNAQVNTYTFSQTAGSYTPITGGTLHGSGTGVDENAYTGIAIGFTYNFNGTNYTSVNILSNGFVYFGSTVSATFNYTPISSSFAAAGVISAASLDLQGHGTAELRSELTGTSPNRIFTIQWKNFKYYSSTGDGDTLNFQIKLYETTNAAEIVYGNCVKNATNRSVQVGLRGASNSDFVNRKVVSGTHTWSGSAAGTANNDYCELRTALVPSSGLTLTWSKVPPGNMYYVSSTATQSVTTSIDPGTADQQIIGVSVVTNASANPVNAQKFTFRMNGTTNVADVTNAKLFYTSTTGSFSTGTPFGATISDPTGTLTFTGTQALASGTNYFWLSYSIAPDANGGDLLDAVCDSITVADTMRTPTLSAPAGARNVSSSMAYTSSTTTQTALSPVMAGSTGQQMIGVQIVTANTLNPIQSQSFTFNTSGTTDAAHITNARLWSTGTSAAFAMSTQVGSTVVGPSGSFGITGNTTLATGTNYFWLTYDIGAGSSSGEVFDAQCTSVTVAGSSYTPSVTAPSGNRGVLVPLTGTKVLGPGGEYLTFSSLVSDLNTVGVGTGGVTILVTAGEIFSESAPLTLTATGTAANRIAIRRNGAGANPVLNVTGTSGSTDAGIKLSGSDHITVDGLTVKNAGSSSSNFLEYGFHLFASGSDGCKNDSIKNCTVELDPSTSGGIGIYSQAAPSDATGAGSNSFNVFAGNTVKNARVGYQFHNTGTSGSTADSGNVVGGSGSIQFNYSSNFSSLAGIKVLGVQRGMKLSGQVIDYYEGGGGVTGIDLTANGSYDLFGNEIRIRTSSLMTGISVGMSSSSSTSTVNIYRNKLHAMKTYSTAVGANGISVNTSTATVALSLYNNMLYDIDAPATTASAPNVKGINLSTASNVSVSMYYNTVLLTGNNTATSTYGTASLYVSSVGSLDLRNNMLINLSTPGTGAAGYAAALMKVSTSFTEFLPSDYNLLYAGTPSAKNLVFYSSAANKDQTLSDFQSRSATDAHSVAVPVVFAADTAHIGGASLGNVQLIGTTGTGITTDMDGDARHALYPYIGADESASHPLPVELTMFTATPAGTGVELFWRTATERQNHGFEIQRRMGEGWATIGSVAGHGTSNEPREYRFMDRSVRGTATYRLMQVDLDGAVQYSKEVEATAALRPEEYPLSQNYPNPFNPSTQFRFALHSAEHVTVTVYDILGKEVAVLFNGVAEPQRFYTVTFHAEGLAGGLYFYSLRTPSRNEVRKMLMVK